MTTVRVASWVQVAVVLVASLGLAILAGEPPAAEVSRKPSTYAPAKDVESQVQFFLERIKDDLKSETAYGEESIKRVARDANTLAVLALVALGGPAAAQTGGQEQIVKDGKKYMYQGKQIKTPGELKPIVANHPEAAAAASKSSTYRGFALVLGAVGGGLIGWPIGQAIGGAEDPNWALAAAGAGALAVAIWTGVSSD